MPIFHLTSQVNNPILSDSTLGSEVTDVRTTLQCQLTCAPSVTLSETEFTHPLLETPQRATRGKTEGALDADGSFQWTSAVQALTILLLRTVALAQTSQHEETGLPSIAGEQGTGAAALDYAIARGAQWICEMFGWDSHGQAIAKRLFLRSNPERKRPGPVIIRLNPHALHPMRLTMMVDGKRVTDAVELLRLADRLTEQLSAQDRVCVQTRASTGHTDEAIRNTLPYPFMMAEWHTKLATIFTDEVTQMLRATEIFHADRLRETIHTVTTDPSFVKIAPANMPLVSEIDTELAGAHRLGTTADETMLRRYLSRNEPLRFGVTPSQTGLITILAYLQQVKGYNIAINFRYALTWEMMLGIRDGGNAQFPQCCAISTPTAAAMHQYRTPYRPLMVVPSASHHIVAPMAAGNNASITRGDYHLLHEIPATPSFYYDTLVTTGAIDPAQSCLTHVDPDTTSALLQSGNPDLRAILWFPHDVINQMFNNCLFLTKRQTASGVIDNILVCHEELFHDPKWAQAIDIAIRDAWLTLRESPAMLDLVVQLMMANSEYLRFLCRCSGLHHLLPAGADWTPAITSTIPPAK